MSAFIVILRLILAMPFLIIGVGGLFLGAIISGDIDIIDRGNKWGK